MNNFTSVAAGALWTDRRNDRRAENRSDFGRVGEFSHPKEFSEVSADYLSGIESRRHKAKGRSHAHTSLGGINKEKSATQGEARSRIESM